MSNTNTGGPAFPTATLAQKTEGGMTLRDYFAAKAMQIYLKAHHDRVLFEEGKYEEATHFWSDEDVATEAYETADAMLKARG
jgi:hypothetical protein